MADIDNFDQSKLRFALQLTELWESFVNEWTAPEAPTIIDFMEYLTAMLEEVASSIES